MDAFESPIASGNRRRRARLRANGILRGILRGIRRGIPRGIRRGIPWRGTPRRALGRDPTRPHGRDRSGRLDVLRDRDRARDLLGLRCRAPACDAREAGDHGHAEPRRSMHEGGHGDLEGARAPAVGSGWDSADARAPVEAEEARTVPLFPRIAKFRAGSIARRVPRLRLSASAREPSRPHSENEVESTHAAQERGGARRSRRAHFARQRATSGASPSRHTPR